MVDEFQDKFYRVYSAIEKLIYWMAHKLDGDVMEFDDIVGELALEVVKGVRAYPDKSDEELVKIISVMLSHRMSELRYKHFKTYRADTNMALSLDSDEIDDDVIPSKEITPEGALISSQVVADTRNLLSATAKIVFDALIIGDERLSWMTWLACFRANSSGKIHATPIIRPALVARALSLTADDVKDAMDEIKIAYKQARIQ